MTEKDFAIDLAKQAGAIIRKNFGLGMKKEWKKDNTPLTVTDTKINQLVIEAAGRHFPDYGVIAEEGNGAQGKEFVWICDPVDGTIPFSHGLPIATFSLGLTKNGRSILGVVYDPFLDRLYVGEKGNGAVMNSKPIHVSSAKQLNQAVVNTGWVKDSPFNLRNLPEALIEQGAWEFSLLSFAYSAVAVASGEFAGSFYAARFPWDAAAIKVIVEEAGGKVTDLFGQDQRYDQPIQGCVVSNGILHDELLKLVKNSLPA